MKPPIIVKRAPVPGPIIAAVDRWRVVGKPGILVKTYRFRTHASRNSFVVGALGQESHAAHPVEYVIKELDVMIALTTPGIGATDIDKDAARSLDVLFREIAYGSQEHGILDTKNRSDNRG